MTTFNLTTTDTGTGRLWAGWSRLRAQVERLTRRADGEDLLHDAYVSMAGLADAPRNDEAFLIHAAVNRGRDAFRREAVRGHGEPADAIDWLHDPSPIQDEVMIAQARLARVSDGSVRPTARPLPKDVPYLCTAFFSCSLGGLATAPRQTKPVAP